MGQSFANHPEKDIITGMIKQLNMPTRRYLECRGMPTTYDKLVEYRRDYESYGTAGEETKASSYQFSYYVTHRF